MAFTTSEWVWLLLGAVLTGLGKGGVPGVGNLTVLIFASIIDPKLSVGVLLPVLIAADVVAVTLYRRHVDWRALLYFLPWMMVGVVLGYLVFGYLTARQLQHLIGVIVLATAAVQLGRSRLGAEQLAARPSAWFRALLGVVGGMATMLANAAGPVGQLYFLSLRLPKLLFVGTGAWIFFLINLFKLPWQADLGILSLPSIGTSALLMPAAVAGAMGGPWVMRRIDQRRFTQLVWIFIVIAGLRFLLA